MGMELTSTVPSSWHAARANKLFRCLLTWGGGFEHSLLIRIRCLAAGLSVLTPGRWMSMEGMPNMYYFLRLFANYRRRTE